MSEDYTLPSHVHSPPKYLKTAVHHIDSICRTYNIREWVPMGRWLWHHIKEEERFGNIAPGQKVLELGSGSGSSTLSWSHAGYPITGIELNETLTVASRDLISEYIELQHSPIKILQGSYYPKEYIKSRDSGLHTNIQKIEEQELRKRGLETDGRFKPVCTEDVYQREGINISDFDVIFGFFWPFQLPSIYHMFMQYGRKDAALLAIGPNNIHIAKEMGLRVTSGSNVIRQ